MARRKRRSHCGGKHAKSRCNKFAAASRSCARNKKPGTPAFGICMRKKLKK